MTVIAQDDHLTAGAWAACDQTFYLCLFKTFWGAANDTSAMSLSLEMFL